jgi:alanyl-tRNA synthetase
MELCGGTHVRHTAEIGLFRMVSETGVASGVRRVEAISGTAAYRRAVEHEDLIKTIATKLKTAPGNLQHRVDQLMEELRELQRNFDRLRASGSADIVGNLLANAAMLDGVRVIASEVEVSSNDELRALGDRLRERLGSGAAVLAARLGERVALFALVTDDLISRGVRADTLVREIAALTGGTGGGRPHMAQGGVGDPAQVAAALAKAPELVRKALGL